MVENVYVMTVYDFLDGLLVAITHFNFISVEYLVKDVGFFVFFLGVKRLAYSYCDIFTVCWAELYNVLFVIFVFVFLITRA